MTAPVSIARQFGHDFIRALYQMINTARIYSDNNQLIRKSVRAFQALLDQMTQEGDVHLVLWRGRFHLASEKLSYRRDTAGVVNAMTDYFSKRGLASLNFLEAARNAPFEQIVGFARLLNEAAAAEHPHAWLAQKLGEADCFWVQVIRMQDDESPDPGKKTCAERPETRYPSRYDNAGNAYLSAIETVHEAASKASQGLVGVRAARRLAQGLVDLIREDTALMIGLATIKDYDDYTYVHSVNVALLATCLGKHIGLSDTALEYLSVCGLFHDLGKVGVAKDILLKNDVLTDDEWDKMKAHPLIGVRKILMLNAPQPLRSRIILGPFEHHLNPDMTGYPQTLFMDRLSLLGKILRIADVYEALTSVRAYRPQPYLPDQALRAMWLDGGAKFDVVLLKSFIGMMGIYPIGSVVELRDGGLGIVMDYPAESGPGHPLVLRLRQDASGAYVRDHLVYLADQPAKDKTKRLSIVRGLSSAAVNLNPAEFFLNIK